MARIKKILLVSSIVLAGLLLILAGSAYVFGDKIKDLVVQKVNTHLKAEVSVEDIYFSVFENFPQASVSFMKVKVAESTRIYDAPLAELQKISFTLNLWDLLNQEANINQLILNEGYVQLAYNKEGKENFDILKSSNDSSSSKGSSIELKGVQLNGVSVSYEDEKSDFFTSAETETIKLDGKFSDESFALQIKGLLIYTLDIDKTTWLNRQEITLNTEIQINNESEKILFDNTSLDLGDIALNTKGFWSTNSKGGSIDINARNLEIRQVLSLLPGKVKGNIEQYKSEGELQLKASIKQKKSGDDLRIASSFSIKNGGLFLEEFGEGLSNIQLKGKLDYSDSKQLLEIESFESRLLDDAFKGTMKLSNFKDPYLDLFCLASLDLSNLKRISQAEFLQDSKGKLELDISTRGKLSDLKNPKYYKRVFLDGKVKGEKLSIGGDSLGFRLAETDFFIELKEQNTRIHRLSTIWEDNYYEISAEADNLLGYLIDEGNLKLRGSLKSDRLHFTGPKETEKKNPGDTSSLFQFPERIELDVNVDIKSFELDDFKAENVKGDMSMNDKRLTINSMRFNSCSGEILLNGKWLRQVDGQHKMVAHADFFKVNIKELFREFRDFGQANITQENLSGLLSGQTDIGFLYDKNFTFLPKTLYSYIQLKIDEGRLVNYKPLEALSRFVKVEDLRDIRFQTLSNEIEIRDEKIIVPKMDIKNSALDLAVEGEQKFNGFVNFSVQLQLKDLLASSYAKKHSEDEFEKEEKGISVFIRMIGPPENIEFKYDRRSARKSFKQEMKKEKQTVKELLRKEFGLEPKKENPVKEENSTNWEDDIPE